MMGLGILKTTIQCHVSSSNNDCGFGGTDRDVIVSHEGSPGKYIHVEIFDDEGFHGESKEGRSHQPQTMEYDCQLTKWTGSFRDLCTNVLSKRSSHDVCLSASVNSETQRMVITKGMEKQR